jgi:hypothetical protein
VGPGYDRMSGGLQDLAYGARELAGALDLLPLPSLVLAGDGSALAVNKAWTLLSGVPAEGSRGEGWLGALEPLDRGPLRRLLAGAAAAAEPGSADFRLTGQDGDQWCRWWWRPCAPGQLMVCVTGLDQPAPGDGESWPDAADGSPWRLVRRSEFVSLIARALRRSRWTGAVVAVVAADLNGRSGSQPGDQATLAAARQVLAAGWPAAAGAIVSRNEFAVLCDDLRDPGDVSMLAARLRESARPAAAAASVGWPLRTGVALALADDTAETLIARACRAMRAASAVDDAQDWPPSPASAAATQLDAVTDVVNRLFRVGLALASAASLVKGPAEARLCEAIDELDAVISDIRSAVFASTLESGRPG